jgi:hypothetical protein
VAAGDGAAAEATPGVEDGGAVVATGAAVATPPAVDGVCDAVALADRCAGALGAAVSTHVPCGDGGGGSGPLCGSYRKPSASPLANTWLDTPRFDAVQAPPARDTNTTQ